MLLFVMAHQCLFATVNGKRPPSKGYAHARHTIAAKGTGESVSRMNVNPSIHTTTKHYKRLKQQASRIKHTAHMRTPRAEARLVHHCLPHSTRAGTTTRHASFPCQSYHLRGGRKNSFRRARARSLAGAPQAGEGCEGGEGVLVPYMFKGQIMG